MPEFINGPVNYVQLTGTINNIQKNITIFMDIHLDINNQTRCDSFDSIDISQYLYNLIKTTHVPLDFFLEIRNEQIQQPNTDKRDIYIKDVIEMFKSEFIIKDNEIKYSKSNSKVRLHYLDIRDYLDLFFINNTINNIILPIIESLKDNNINDEEKNKKIDLIKTYIQSMQQHIKEIMKNKKYIQTSNSQKFSKKTQKYYLNKMIHEYNDEELRTNLNDFLNLNIMKYMNDLRNIFSHIIDNLFVYKIQTKNIEYLNNLTSSFISLNMIILKMYAIFTDVYFLRRILDKSYIKNIITYCGKYHALNYMYFLIKFCKFKIIKLYDSNKLSINDIIDKIEKINYVQEVYNLFLMDEKKIKQCTVNIPINELMPIQ